MKPNCTLKMFVKISMTLLFLVFFPNATNAQTPKRVFLPFISNAVPSITPTQNLSVNFPSDEFLQEPILVTVRFTEGSPDFGAQWALVRDTQTNTILFSVVTKNLLPATEIYIARGSNYCMATFTNPSVPAGAYTVECGFGG